MQDNRFHISEEFIDQSWQKMKHSLDKQIPVRRVIPFWIYFAGIILLCIGAFLMWDKGVPQQLDFAAENEKANLTDKKTQTESKVISIPEAGSTSERNVKLELSKSENQKTNLDRKEDNAVMAILETKLNDENSTGASKNAGLNSTSQALLIQEDSKTDLSKNTDDSDHEAMALHHSKEIQDPSIIQSSSNSRIANHRDYLVSSLPSLHLSSLMLLHSIDKPIISFSEPVLFDPIVKVKNENRFQPGIYASLLKGSKSHGFEAGLFGSLKLNPHWNMSFSIGMHQLNYDISEEDLIESAADLGAAIDTNFASNPNPILDQALVSDLITKTNHFEGQFMMGYQVFPKLCLNGGVGISYLSQAKNKEISVFRSSALNEVVELEANYLENNEFLESFDIALLAGIEWRVHNRVSITGQYHYGLNEIFKLANENIFTPVNPAENKYLRFGRFGLKLYL